MRYFRPLMIGAVSMSILVTSGGEVLAQSQKQNPNRKKARWDVVKMAADVGGIALGAATLNPFIVGVSSGALVRNSYRLGKHTIGGQGNPTTTAPTSIAQPESLVAVPGRLGYFYYPSNPNQLYVDANAPARITVVIANMAKDGRTVRYSVSGTDYAIPPGYSQLVIAFAGSIISYDRVDTAGTEMFTLTDGAYEFRASEQGWRLYATGQTVANVAKAKSDARPTEASKSAAAVR